MRDDIILIILTAMLLGAVAKNVQTNIGYTLNQLSNSNELRRSRTRRKRVDILVAQGIL